MTYLEALEFLTEKGFDVIVNESGEIFDLADCLQQAKEESFQEDSQKTNYIVEADFKSATVTTMLGDGRRGRVSCWAYFVWEFDTCLDSRDPLYESAKQTCKDLNATAQANGYTTEHTIMSNRLGELSPDVRDQYRLVLISSVRKIIG